MSNVVRLKKRPGLPWLVVAWVGVCLLTNFLVVQNQQWLRLQGIREGYWVGGFFGEVLIAVMFAGLLGRTWMMGWFLCTCLFVLGMSAGLAVEGLQFGAARAREEWIAVLLIMPWITLGACVPLVAMRSLRGWSLTRSGQLEVPRHEYRLEDLFFFSVSVACALSLFRLSLVAGNAPSGAEFVMVLFAAGLSLLLALPLTVITFRLRSWPVRLGAYAAMTLAALLVTAAICWFTSANVFDFERNFFELIQVFPVCVVFGLIGILTMWFSGYRLTYYAPKAPAPAAADVDPLAADEAEPGKPVERDAWARRETRWLTAGLAMVTLLMVVGNAYNQKQLGIRFQAWSNPRAYFGAEVERIDLGDAEIVGVIMAPSATAADVAKVAAKLPQLERLSLAGTKFTDDDLSVLSRFRRLQHLDLSRTAVTGQAC